MILVHIIQAFHYFFDRFILISGSIVINKAFEASMALFYALNDFEAPNRLEHLNVIHSFL